MVNLISKIVIKCPYYNIIYATVSVKIKFFFKTHINFLSYGVILEIRQERPRKIKYTFIVPFITLVVHGICQKIIKNNSS